MTISFVDVISLLRGCSAAENPPGRPLSVDWGIGRVPYLFDATVVEVTPDSSTMLLREVDSSKERSVNLSGAESFAFTQSSPEDWVLVVRFEGGHSVLLSTKER